ncbi:MAG: hypothetical protein ACKVU2_08355 [Saprospiraceae bacterium]
MWSVKSILLSWGSGFFGQVRREEGEMRDILTDEQQNQAGKDTAQQSRIDLTDH